MLIERVSVASPQQRLKEGSEYADPKKHYFFQGGRDYKAKPPPGPVFKRLCPVCPAAQKNKIGLIHYKHVS